MTTNNTVTDKVHVLIDKAERVSVLGSPSSTSGLSLDILGTAVTKKLVGELALFRYLQDNTTHYALGQITEVQLRNIWHEDPTMRSLIRQRGHVDAVSGRQDTHQGKMTISAVFAAKADGYLPSILGTVPATGTPVHLVDDEILDVLLSPYRQQLFYLGNVYGSTPKLPLWFKHFDVGPDGAGEAYHVGIFGKTGSGKSVLAKMVLIGYAKHPKMGLFVFDPQGEFSIGLRDNAHPKHMGGVFCQNVLRTLGRDVHVYDLTKMQLDRWEIFTKLLLEFGFFFDLGIKSGQYQETAADYLNDHQRWSGKHTLSNLLTNDAFLAALTHLRANIQRIYGTSAGIDRVTTAIDEATSDTHAGKLHPLKEKWDKAARFFREASGTRKPDDIVRAALSGNGKRPIVVIDLSRRPDEVSQTIWDERIKPLIISRFLSALIFEAERAYHDERSLNTLVVLDEAHRLAPRESGRNEKVDRIKRDLVDAVRTTRKYGLGWAFLSQTLSSLDNEIVQQLRIFFFGFGLSMGTEYQKLQELVSDRESIKLYQSFRDPQSAFDTNFREYPFMTIGPVSPLSFSGTPLFFNAFNNVDRFLQANQLMMQGQLLQL